METSKFILEPVDLNHIKKTLEDIKADLQLIKEGKQPIALSISEAAKSLSCSRTTIRNLWKAGKLEGYQDEQGSKIFIYSSSINSYLRGA